MPLNLVIHILAGLTLFELSGARSCGGRVRRPRLIAFSVALLWTLHPLQTESVTYIVQRAESLMGLFYLLTVYCFIRGMRGGGAAARRQPLVRPLASPPACSAWPPRK